MLRQQGLDIKAAQELHRHANCRTTRVIYQKAVSEEKRIAQNPVFAGLLEGRSTQPPSAPAKNV
jgi:hypothetical protein